MAEEITTAPDGERARQAPGSGGRWLALLALLIALAAVCGFAWLYYALVIHNPAAGMAERLSALQASQAQLRADLESLAGRRQAAFEAFRTELEERQRTSENELAESLGGLSLPDFPPDRNWKLAEVELLLRAANHRVLFERDPDSALVLLRSADGILGELGGPAALGVRTTIATEMLSLEQAQVADPSAIYLRLDAIKRRLTHLTLALPEYTAIVPDSESLPEEEIAAPPAGDIANPVANAGFIAETSPETEEPSQAREQQLSGHEAATTAEAIAASEEPGFFSTLGRELGRLVRFRRFDTSLERPPAPAESDLLEVNLRLMLEQAQLAALKRDQAVYAISLDAALDWTGALLDSQDTRVQETIGTLEALRRLDLQAPLPDISGSLNELLEARREQS